MAEYVVIQHDMTDAQDHHEIVAAQQPVSSIALLDLPAGAQIDLQIGEGRRIPLTAPIGINNLCPPETRGVFVTHAAQVGAVATFVAFFQEVEVET